MLVKANLEALGNWPWPLSHIHCILHSDCDIGEDYNLLVHRDYWVIVNLLLRRLELYLDEQKIFNKGTGILVVVGKKRTFSVLKRLAGVMLIKGYKFVIYFFFNNLYFPLNRLFLVL